MAYMSSDFLDLVMLHQQLQSWQHEQCMPGSAIVCLGDAKVGKTTTISYLLSYDLEIRMTPIPYLDDGGRVVHTTQRRDIGYADPGLQQDAPIGVGLDPITKSPQFHDLDAITAIVDSPGRSKRCRCVDMANDIGQQRMLHELPAVVPVYLIKTSCLSQPNYLKDQLQLVQRMFPVIDEVKDTLLFVFTYVNGRTANDVLGLLDANLQKIVQSDEALSPYISLMIDQVQEHSDTLLVRPLDGNPDGLRELLLAREPLLKGKVCYGSSISAEALNEIQLAMHTESTLIKHAHREGKYDQARKRLQALRNIAMELKDTTLMKVYTQLQTSFPVALETSTSSGVSAMLHQGVWTKTSLSQDVKPYGSLSDEGLADSQHSLNSLVDICMLDDATKSGPEPAQPQSGDWVLLARKNRSASTNKQLPYDQPADLG